MFPKGAKRKTVANIALQINKVISGTRTCNLKWPETGCNLKWE